MLTRADGPEETAVPHAVEGITSPHLLIEMSDSKSSNLRRRPWFEPVTVIMMGMATLLTAWSSFENTRWTSRSRNLMEQSDFLARESLAMHIDSQQIKMVHFQIFSELVNAKLAGDEKRFEFYSQRTIDELKPAFEAWMAERPFENLATSAHPFTDQYYKPRHQEEIVAAREAADQAKEQSSIAGGNAAGHLSNTIILSAVLFFAGTARTFDQRKVRTTVLSFAFALLLFSIVRMLFLPIA